MARLRNLRAAAVNIAIEDKRHHDSPASYRRLIELMFSSNKAVKVQGDRRLLIGYLATIPDDPDGLHGIFDRYTEIEGYRWYNKARREPASADEMVRVSIPAQLSANHREYPFYFDLKIHKLTFVAADAKLRLTPNQVQHLLSEVSNDTRVRDEFGVVSITVEQERDAIAKIIHATELRALTIQVKQSNSPDSLTAFNRSFLSQAARANSAVSSVEFHPPRGESLKPTKDIENLADYAGSNGEVSAKVRKGGVVREVSSLEYPLEVTQKYNPRKDSQWNALLRAAAEIRKIFRPRPPNA